MLSYLEITDGISSLVEGVLILVLMGLTLSAQVFYQNSFDRTSYQPSVEVCAH